MKKIQQVLFYFGLATLFTHELDAVMHKEWLVLPLTSWLNPDTGYEAFLWLHVPLFFVVVSCLASLNLKVRTTTMHIISIFMVVHAVLHWAFSSHKHYYFTGFSSSALIYISASMGIAYFVVSYIAKEKNA